MKFYLVVAIFCKVVEILSQDTKRNSLQKAFVDIAEFLATRNYLVAVVEGPAFSKASQLISLAITAGIPQAVTKLENEKELFWLDSSAIVLMTSVNSLKKFNDRTFLPASFSMQQQLFVYCRGGTFDEISRIETLRNITPIVQFEYFVIEEKKSIRLLTFLWYTPKKCDVAQLVEVNRFD